MRPALLAVGCVALSCGGNIPDATQRDREGGVAAVRITTTAGERGSPRSPLPFSTNGVTYTLRVEVLDARGAALPGFEGYLGLSVTPGLLQRVESPGAVGNYVRLTRGVVEGVRVTIARGYGEVRLWAEDEGYSPEDPRGSSRPQCADGLDNDQDGRVDFPADDGCAASNDGSERGGSYAVGTSEPYYFGSPLLSDVQGHSAVSPLTGERITIPGRGNPSEPTAMDPTHRLVVTKINNSGFFVTDVDDRSCTEGGRALACYNSIFAFNFRAPEGLRPCDLLSVFQGSVSEFVGYTELNQPGYQVGLLWRPMDPQAGPCLIPDATVLTPELRADEARMEWYEAGLVRVENVLLPTMIGPALAPMGVPARDATNCDLNGDGRVNFQDLAEAACANACAANPTCSEWSAWRRFGQVMVTLPGMASAPARILFTPRDVQPSFDPQRPRGPAATLTGTLRQVGPNWIIEPRCEADMVLQGDGQTVRPARDTCLHERSEREE